MHLASLIEHYRCIAIVGMEKNAGKTTVLNHLLENYRGRPVAITSIGYDGEETDQVTGTIKPRIYVERGTLFATASGLLPRCDVTRELLKFTGLPTAMGEVILVRARSDGYVQVAGPAITAQMEKLLGMLNEFHPEKFFIDGAAARKSSAAISAADACILATGAAFSPDPETIIEQTLFSAGLLNLPVCKDSQALDLLRHLPSSQRLEENEANQCYAVADNVVCLGSSLAEDAPMRAAAVTGLQLLVFKGACPTGFARRFLEKTRKLEGLTLTALDGTRFLLTSEQFNEFLRRGASFRVARSANLLAIAVNPTSPAGLQLDTEKLQEELQRRSGLPVFDVIATRSGIKNEF